MKIYKYTNIPMYKLTTFIFVIGINWGECEDGAKKENPPHLHSLWKQKSSPSLKAKYLPVFLTQFKKYCLYGACIHDRSFTLMHVCIMYKYMMLVPDPVCIMHMSMMRLKFHDKRTNKAILRIGYYSENCLDSGFGIGFWFLDDQSTDMCWATTMNALSALFKKNI